MFTRTTKNPFENTGLSAKTESENIAAGVMARTRRLLPTPPKEEGFNEVPPRLFEERSSIQDFESGNKNTTAREREEGWANETSSSPFANKASQQTDNDEPETTLGEGVSFKGQLSFRRLLRIDGSFEGELISDGKLLVGPKGSVKSNINMREAVIEGTVQGNITVQERLELRGDAEVHGNIIAKYLSVDEGVTLIGSVTVKPRDAED